MIEREKLVELAVSAMEMSYSPYSGYKVGAALLCPGGEVFLGCNIENSSFSPTVCAERTAIFKAVSEGYRDFTDIAIVGGKGGVISSFSPPCGVCRQVMSEFCDADGFRIHLFDGKEYKTFLLKELLPEFFDPEEAGILKETDR